MNVVKRPPLVTFLSLMAFGSSPLLIAALTFFFFNVYTRDEVPSLMKDPIAFVWLSVWEALLVIAFVLLSWLSLTAGIDLWRFKERGRHLALFSMPMLLCVGAIWCSSGEFWSTVAGSALCVLSAASFIYLLLPSTRKRFEASPKMPLEAQVRETAAIVGAFLRRGADR